MFFTLDCCSTRFSSTKRNGTARTLMELGASELYRALSSALGNVASGLPVTDPNVY
jgi:hypothetical protein